MPAIIQYNWVLASESVVAAVKHCRNILTYPLWSPLGYLLQSRKDLVFIIVIYDDWRNAAGPMTCDCTFFQLRSLQLETHTFQVIYGQIED